jgi:hypothetical protein
MLTKTIALNMHPPPQAASHVTLTAFSQFGKQYLLEYVNKGHSFGHILTRNHSVSRGSIWFVPQVTVAEFNVQCGCDKSGIFKILF